MDEKCLKEGKRCIMWSDAGKLRRQYHGHAGAATAFCDEAAVEAELVNVDVERAVGCQPGYRCLGGELIPCPPGTRGGDQGGTRPVARAHAQPTEPHRAPASRAARQLAEARWMAKCPRAEPAKSKGRRFAHLSLRQPAGRAGLAGPRGDDH